MFVPKNTNPKEFKKLQQQVNIYKHIIILYTNKINFLY